MMHLLLVCLVLAFGSGPAHAQTTLISRLDFTEVSAPSPTEAVITPQVEMWAIGWNSKSGNQELWLGHLAKVNNHISLGGYTVEFPDRNQHFLLPWLAYRKRIGSAKLCVDLGYYLPLNGAKPRLISPESSVAWLTGKNLEIGIVASTLKVGSGPMPIRLGPTVRVKLGSSVLKLNWGPYSVNGDTPGRLRVQLATSF